MKLDRTFRFRGRRDYLHSASLFDDILKIRGADATHIDLKFHQRTAQQVSYTDRLPAGREPVAEWWDARGKLYVVAREEPIADTEPYDEPTLARMLWIDGKTVFVPEATPGFSRIEAIIAGFKRLMQETRPTDKQYVFVRVRLERLPEGAMQVRYTRDIGDFFQGDILADGRLAGQVFFGEWA
ncbi:MAG TPA: hypothetical protein VFY97_10575 [Rhodanobacteraceae bacterium]|nr:hypothetical protein [Rhodanobacteraceae bacterium]